MNIVHTGSNVLQNKNYKKITVIECFMIYSIVFI